MPKIDDDVSFLILFLSFAEGNRMFFRCFQSLKIHLKATFFSKNNPNIAWIMIWECLEIVLFDAQKMCYWITHWPTVTHDFFTRRIFTKTPYLPWNSWPMRFTWKNFFSGIPCNPLSSNTNITVSDTMRFKYPKFEDELHIFLAIFCREP